MSLFISRACGNRQPFMHSAAAATNESAAQTALSVEVRDFEEEKSLV